MPKKAPIQSDKLHRAFGARIRDLRQARGISQEALGDEVGLHRTYIGRVERGETNATLENISILATALGVSLAELFSPFVKQADDGTDH